MTPNPMSDHSQGGIPAGGVNVEGEKLAPLKYARYPSTKNKVGENSEEHMRCSCVAMGKAGRHCLLAVGYEDGKISLINARTGKELCNTPVISSNYGGSPVQALSFDASGTYLGAINKDGQSAVFEFQYKPDIFDAQPQNIPGPFGSSSIRPSDELELVPSSTAAYQNVHRYVVSGFFSYVMGAKMIFVSHECQIFGKFLQVNHLFDVVV